MLSLPRAWVQSLVGELRSRKPHGMAKKKGGLSARCHSNKRKHQGIRYLLKPPFCPVWHSVSFWLCLSGQLSRALECQSRLTLGTARVTPHPSVFCLPVQEGIPTERKQLFFMTRSSKGCGCTAKTWCLPQWPIMSLSNVNLQQPFSSSAFFPCVPSPLQNWGGYMYLATATDYLVYFFNNPLK